MQIAGLPELTGRKPDMSRYGGTAMIYYGGDANRNKWFIENVLAICLFVCGYFNTLLVSDVFAVRPWPRNMTT